MFDLGLSELLLVGIVALIIVGPQDLPRMFRIVGKYVGRAKEMARDFQKSFEDAAKESGFDEVKRNFDTIKDFNPNAIAKKTLKGKLPVASVSTGFPAGMSSFETRKKEIVNSIKYGADEIDIVINRSFVLRNQWLKLYNEIKDFKKVSNGKKLKVILGVGELGTLRNVAKASLVAMMAGADFIKTSTGKEKTNANLNNSLVMLRMIREFYYFSGKKIGFKPAGGISSSKDVLSYLMLMYEELGTEWMQPNLFRIGASRLLIDIERQLYHYALGRYATINKMAMA